MCSSPCSNFENFSGAGSYGGKDNKRFVKCTVKDNHGLKKCSSPAMTALVEATAGMILFTTPAAQKRVVNLISARSKRQPANSTVWQLRSDVINLTLKVKNSRLLICTLTLSESVRHSCNTKLCGSLLGSFKHPLDVLWVVSIQTGF